MDAGELEAHVVDLRVANASLAANVANLSTVVSNLSTDVKNLSAVMNRGKGALAAVVAGSATVGSFVTLLAHWALKF
jgi:hypothetical protein